MDTMERTNRTAQRLMKTSADSYKMVVDHMVAQQERNVRFTQGLLEGTARELRHQAESNRSVVGELVKRSETQRDAYRTLVGEWLEAYTDLLYGRALATGRVCVSSRARSPTPRSPSPATTR